MICLGGILAGTVLVGAVQGHVAHAVHRLRPFPAPIADRHVADHAVDDFGRHMLRPLPGSRNQSNPEFGLVAAPVPRKGNCGSSWLRFCVCLCVDSNHATPSGMRRRGDATIGGGSFGGSKRLRVYKFWSTIL